MLREGGPRKANIEHKTTWDFSRVVGILGVSSKSVDEVRSGLVIHPAGVVQPKCVDIDVGGTGSSSAISVNSSHYSKL